MVLLHRKDNGSTILIRPGTIDEAAPIDPKDITKGTRIKRAGYKSLEVSEAIDDVAHAIRYGNPVVGFVDELRPVLLSAFGNDAGPPLGFDELPLRPPTPEPAPDAQPAAADAKDDAAAPTARASTPATSTADRSSRNKPKAR